MSESGFRLEDVYITVEHQNDEYIAIVEHYYTEQVISRETDETKHGAIGKAILVVMCQQMVIEQMKHYRTNIRSETIRKIISDYLVSGREPLSELNQDVIWAYQRAIRSQTR